jgi:hypothetical protein
VHTISSRKCKATNCEEVSHEGWCSSFGFSKNLVEVTNVEGPRNDSWNVQLTPNISNQNIQIGIQSFNFSLKFD